MTNLIRNWRSKYIYLFFIKKNKIKLGPSRHTHKNNIYLTLKKKKLGDNWLRRWVGMVDLTNFWFKKICQNSITLVKIIPW